MLLGVRSRISSSINCARTSSRGFRNKNGILVRGMEKRTLLVDATACRSDFADVCLTEESKRRVKVETKSFSNFHARGSVINGEAPFDMVERDASSSEKACNVGKNRTAKVGNLGIRKNFLSPPMDKETRNAIDTCTGVWISGNMITWARLNRYCDLLEWECQEFENATFKDLPATVDSVVRIVSKISPSSAYVMESEPVVPFTRINNAIYCAQLWKQQILATVITCLGTKERFGCVNDGKDSTMHVTNVYTMRARTTARLFNLLVGSEIVSTKSVIKQIILDEKDPKDNENVNNDDDNDNDKKRRIRTRVNSDVRGNYVSKDIYKREQMNWALLLTLAFIDLSIGPNVGKEIELSKKKKIRESKGGC